MARTTTSRPCKSVLHKMPAAGPSVVSGGAGSSGQGVLGSVRRVVGSSAGVGRGPGADERRLRSGPGGAWALWWRGESSTHVMRRPVMAHQAARPLSRCMELGTVQTLASPRKANQVVAEYEARSLVGQGRAFMSQPWCWRCFAELRHVFIEFNTSLAVCEHAT
jgi:hypothetical protein